LYLVDAAIAAERDLGAEPFAPPILMQASQTIREHRTVCHYRTGIAEGSEVFRWVEAEGGQIAKAANASAVEFCTVCLGAILDDHDIGICCSAGCSNRGNIDNRAIQVGADDGARSFRAGLCDKVRVDEQRDGIDVDWHCGGTQQLARDRAVPTGIRHHDDLVVMTDSRSAKRQLEGIRAVRNPDTGRHAHKIAELPLERLCLRAQQVPAAVDHPGNRLLRGREFVGRRSAEIVERNWILVCCWSTACRHGAAIRGTTQLGTSNLEYTIDTNARLVPRPHMRLEPCVPLVDSVQHDGDGG
jgi:hypothetical protein